MIINFKFTRHYLPNDFPTLAFCSRNLEITIHLSQEVLQVFTVIKYSLNIHTIITDVFFIFAGKVGIPGQMEGLEQQVIVFCHVDLSYLLVTKLLKIGNSGILPPAVFNVQGIN